MVGAHTHNLSAGGLKLGERLLEAEELLGSGSCEGLDEGEEDDGTLGGEVGQFDLLAAGGCQAEIWRFLPDLEGGDRADEAQAGEQQGHDQQRSDSTHGGLLSGSEG